LEIAAAADLDTGEGGGTKQEKRIWKLQRLDVDVAEDLKAKKGKNSKGDDGDDMDEEDFYREMDADKEMRAAINLYKEDIKSKKTDECEVTMEEEPDADVDDDQEVKLEELLDGLALDKGPDGELAAANPVPLAAEEIFAATVEEGERAARDGLTYIGRDSAKQIPDKESAVPVDGTKFGTQFETFKFT